ncbi:MAG: type II toxin-antitoxin system VapC family toxin [Spirochaetaceae bacterium]|nr:type II toxin-antitoxin system VapC family toxin [Spirochaetaceae bacterium]
MYLLDTNICIYIIKKHPEIVSKFDQFKPSDIKMSSIVLSELEYGAAKSKKSEQNRNALRNFASSFDIIPFDARDTELFGIIRAELERQGEPIGPYDLQIAAQAVSRKFTLVTNNVGEFKRIRNLSIENWA